MQQLTFTEGTAYNSLIVDAATRAILYDVRTPKHFGSHTTTIHNGQGALVGTYEYSAFSHKVTIGGQTSDLDSWMPKDGGRLSRTWHIWGPDGRQYQWSQNGRLSHEFTLIDRATGTTVATFVWGSGGKHSHSSLSVHPNAMHILDSIVLSAIVIDQRLRAARAAVIAAAC